MTQHAKDSRSDVLNMRIDPKLKYLADIAARYRGQTLSKFIEDAVKRALAPQAVLDDEPTPGTEPRVKHEQPLWNEGLWHQDEAVRLFMLATANPTLLKEQQKERWLAISSATARSGTKLTLRSFTEAYREAK